MRRAGKTVEQEKQTWHTPCGRVGVMNNCGGRVSECENGGNLAIVCPHFLLFPPIDLVQPSKKALIIPAFSQPLIPQDSTHHTVATFVSFQRSCTGRRRGVGYTLRPSPPPLTTPQLSPTTNSRRGRSSVRSRRRTHLRGETTSRPAAKAYASRLIGQDGLRDLINRGRLIGLRLCIEVVHEACGLQPSAREQVMQCYRTSPNLLIFLPSATCSQLQSTRIGKELSPEVSTVSRLSPW